MKASPAGRFDALTTSTHQIGASRTADTRFVRLPWHQPSPQNFHAQRSEPCLSNTGEMYFETGETKQAA